MSKINVVLVADSNYLNYLEIALKSLLSHNENLLIFVINTGDISSDWAISLQSFFRKRGCSLQLVYIDKSSLANFNASGYISAATYLRFYIPHLFKLSDNPYWVYLDCDVVINGNIVAPFYQYNFSNYRVGAVSDRYVLSLKEHPYVNRDYLNAGVLYLNANKFNPSFVSDLIHLSKELKEKIIFGDQDILNYYLKDEWITLPYNYNFQLEHMIYSQGSKIEPSIIHFTGPKKPLDKVNHSDKNVMSIISLFRLYNSLCWDDIVNLPVGTIKLKLE